MYSKGFLFVNFLNIVFFFINCTEAVLLQEFEINILDHDERVNVTVKLVRNSYLANEHLPVWTMEGNDILPYKELNVMPKLGTTASYFNYEKKAAFIYSSKCNCLNGVIDVRYIIKKLPMHLIYNTQIIGESTYITHRKKIKPRKLFNTKTPPRTEEELKINERAVNKTLYPEILLVIKNDFYSNWKPTDISNEEMILYIISLMNAADMLYSPAETLKIKLNIAGIIIESQKNLLPVMPDHSHEAYLSAESLVYRVINSNYTHFEKFKLNPKLSFDWIFFFTSKKLFYLDHHNLTRISSYPKGGIVQSRQEGCGHFNTPISIITDDYEYISYPTVGHEAFHLISYGSQKKIENSDCHFGFLEVYDVPYLEKFQWSDDCCLLTNKPQSLNFIQPPMDPKYQCQCYGYEKNYFIEPTVCTGMLTCEDAKKYEQTVPRIVDNEFCREKWERKRVELMDSVHIATSTASTTTVIPPLTIEDQCEWITKKLLSNMMFIFPQENMETDDNGLVCLAIIVDGNNSDERKMAFTAKSCVMNSIKLRNHLIKKEDGYTIAASQSEADFSVTVESIDNFDDDTASLNPEGISDNFIKLSSLKSSQEIMNLSVNKECHFINVTKVSNSVKPFIIKYIPIDILIQYKEGSTSNYIIKSKNPVNKSDLWGLKGNPLFCKFSNGKTELVGILVDDDYDKHLRFMNIADYKETIQNKMNLSK